MGTRTENLGAPARTLSDVYKTLSPKPLIRPEDLDAFYRDINNVRGGGVIGQMALSLGRASQAGFYKAFLMGHPGSGKSTELSQLIRQVKQQYQAIRLSATDQLDPANLKPFDILLLTMVRVAEETAKPVADGGAGQPVNEQRLKEIWDWFAEERRATQTANTIMGTASAGVGIKGGSFWASVLGLFGELTGEMKHATERRIEVVEYRLQRVSALIEMANRLLDDCNAQLQDATQKEWLLVWEDFDKPGFPKGRVEELFLTYAHLFKALRTHLIFTIPIVLGYSSQSRNLPVPTEQRLVIPDVPVYHRDHSPHQEGREAIRSILEARVAPNLFADNAMTRLIVASGGNLRDLFSLVAKAADDAILRNPGTNPPDLRTDLRIERENVSRAITWLRGEYEKHLGTGPLDEENLNYEQKAARMLDIYRGKKTAAVPDPCLYTLLRAQAVQGFNGERWLGIHPLVVDILKKQGMFPEGEGALGGTE